nr:MAG TPA: hypothetical protein [Caudoviricetes sp.]
MTPTPGAEATIDTPETRDQLFEYFVARADHHRVLFP